MSGLNENINELAGDYVLGLLSQEENTRVENDLLNNQPLRAAVKYWREKLSPLDETALEMSPSRDLWQTIEKEVSVKSYPRAPAVARSFPKKTLRGFGIYMAIAASLLLFAFPILRDNFMAQKRTGIAILTDENAKTGALVEIYGNEKVVILSLANIDVPDDKSLQVWTLQDRAVGPISLGLMENKNGGKFKIPPMPNPIANQLYEITLEPKGGSPLNRPTGQILYKGLAKLDL